MRRIRLGVGAGYAGDRIEPAVELAEKGDLHYLVFEGLTERLGSALPSMAIPDREQPGK